MQTGFRLDNKHNSQTNWTLQGDIYKNNENQDIFLVGNSIFQPVQTVHDEYSVSGWNILGRLNHEIDEQTSTSLQMYLDHDERDEIYLQQSHTNFDIDFQYQTRLADRHNVIFGASYRHLSDDFNNRYISVTPSQTDTNLYSAFIQDEIELSPNKLNLTIGTKLEHNDYTGIELQPNIRLAWLIDSQQTLWSAISKAIRTPSRYERDSQTISAYTTSQGIPVVYNILGNPDFNSEELLTYEIGYRNQLNKTTSFDATLFYHDLSELLTGTVDISTPIPTLSIINKNSGKTYGLEVSSNFSLSSSWRIQSSYSFAESIGVNDINNRQGSLPKHQLSLRSLYEINENLQFDLWAVYVDELPYASAMAGSSRLIIEPYTRLNLRLAWKPTNNIELSLIGQNLLDKKRLEITAENYVRPVEISRSIYAQVKWIYE